MAKRRDVNISLFVTTIEERIGTDLLFSRGRLKEEKRKKWKKSTLYSLQS